MSSQLLKSSTESGSVATGRIAALLTGAGVAAIAHPDPDLWGHLRFGLDLLDEGRLTRTDPYSFTQDVAWINHEWLSELLLAAAFRAGGVSGMMLLKLLVLTISFLLLVRLSRGAEPQYRWWLLALVFFNVGPIGLTLRPQIWTILGLTVLFTILVGHVQLAWMPLLFLVWANLHGGWIVGVGFTGLWMLGTVLDARRVSVAVRPALLLLLSVAATGLNPYGSELWAFLARTVRMSRPDITEWRPYWEDLTLVTVLLLPLLVGALSTTLVARRRYVTWARLLPTLWLGVNAVLVARLAALFALATGYVTFEGWRRGRPSVEERTIPARRAGRFVIDASAVALVVAVLAWPQAKCLAIPDDWKLDLVAASAFEPKEVRGRLVVPFNWGEFAIWHWSPRLKVSIDGRRETVYSESTVLTQQALGTGHAAGISFVRQARPEYAWIQAPSAAPAVQWMVHNGYALDVDTGTSVVLRRRDLPPLQTGQPLSRCAF